MALLTTFYGIMVANLVLLPLSRKLKEYLRYEARIMALATEGVMAILDGEHPTAVDHRLRSAFLSQRDHGLVPASQPQGAGRAVKALSRV